MEKIDRKLEEQEKSKQASLSQLVFFVCFKLKLEIIRISKQDEFQHPIDESNR